MGSEVHLGQYVCIFYGSIVNSSNLFLPQKISVYPIKLASKELYFTSKHS